MDSRLFVEQGFCQACGKECWIPVMFWEKALQVETEQGLLARPWPADTQALRKSVNRMSGVREPGPFHRPVLGNFCGLMCAHTCFIWVLCLSILQVGLVWGPGDVGEDRDEMEMIFLKGFSGVSLGCSLLKCWQGRRSVFGVAA